MKKYSNKTVIESLGLPMLTCFDDLVKELSLSGKLVYWLTVSAKYSCGFSNLLDSSIIVNER